MDWTDYTFWYMIYITDGKYGIILDPELEDDKKDDILNYMSKQ